MGLSSNEVESGGFVRDPDHRLVVVAPNLGVGSLTAFYPANSTPVVAASGTKAAASATATITPAATQTAYITGFQVTGSGATAASVIAVTVATLVGGVTLTYELVVPAGATTTVQPLVVQFPVPLPANAVNTAITVTVPSFGTGSTNASVCAQGFIL